MTILAVDNQYTRLFALRDCLQSVYPNDKIRGFTFPQVAVYYSQRNQVDILFAENSMPEMDGATLAQYVRERNENVVVYFIDDKESGNCADSTAFFLARPVRKDDLMRIRSTRMDMKNNLKEMRRL